MKYCQTTAPNQKSSRFCSDAFWAIDGFETINPCRQPGAGLTPFACPGCLAQFYERGVSMDGKDLLFVVDYSSLLYHAYYANTNHYMGAVCGFLRCLLRIMAGEVVGVPDYLIVACDDKTASWRKALFPAYKSHRPPPPDAFKSQIPVLNHVLDVWGVPRVTGSGAEADDVMASAVAAAPDMDKILVTTDKDMMQLVDDQTSIWDHRSDLLADTEAVYRKFGVRPDQMVDYLAIVGDSSDGIPGVAGIGAMRGARLLQAYGSLDAILRGTPLPNAAPMKLYAGKVRDCAEIMLWKDLVSLRPSEATTIALTMPWWRRTERLDHAAAIGHLGKIVSSYRSTIQVDGFDFMLPEAFWPEASVAAVPSVTEKVF